MKYILTDINGGTVTIENAVSVVLDRDESAAADALTVVFACDLCDRDFASVVVEHEETIIFSGIVDEQTETQTAAALLLEITARSRAALLLDNEAQPQVYHKPSMDELFRRHIEPLGFADYIGENKILNGEMSITKGMSVWQALAVFQAYCGGTEPLIRADGALDVSDSREVQTVILSSNIIIKKSHTKKRCAIISKVYMRGRNGAGYEIETENPLAQRLNICRVRYLNAANTVSTSLDSGTRLIGQGNNAYEYTELTCAGCVLCPVGTKIIIDGQGSGTLTALTYRKSMSGENTDLVVMHNL